MESYSLVGGSHHQLQENTIKWSKFDFSITVYIMNTKVHRNVTQLNKYDNYPVESHFSWVIPEVRFDLNLSTISVNTEVVRSIAGSHYFIPNVLLQTRKQNDIKNE